MQISSHACTQYTHTLLIRPEKNNNNNEKVLYEARLKLFACVSLECIVQLCYNQRERAHVCACVIVRALSNVTCFIAFVLLFFSSNVKPAWVCACTILYNRTFRCILNWFYSMVYVTHFSSQPVQMVKYVSVCMCARVDVCAWARIAFNWIDSISVIRHTAHATAT